MKDHMKTIALLSAIIFVMACAGGVRYYKSTPGYSMGLVEQSVKTHDWDGFCTHVDTERLLSQGFDDTIDVVIEEYNVNGDMKLLARGLSNLMKPVFISEARASMKEWVETGKVTRDEGKETGVSPKDLTREVDIDKCSISKIAYTKRDGDKAVVGFIVHDGQLNKDFTLDAKMEQLGDGTWKIVELSNLSEYLREVHKAAKES